MSNSIIQTINSDAEKIAAAIIDSINYGENPPLGKLIGWLEDNLRSQIDLKHIDLGSTPVCGLTYHVFSKDMYVVRVDKTNPYTRQKFTVAHELGHIIGDLQLTAIAGYFDGELENVKSGLERFCNRFAAAYLMPPEIFKRIWSMSGDKNSTQITKMLYVASRFGVSEEAARYRAIELGLLNYSKRDNDRN
ncbi:MAG TPA: ImmA/IrrE family metallo-endopeptidase [Patescibacteria group bacterium]|nr:ImmA/IrrE family metallo-endopeptidase [Patescibacteria group bacterium]